jgi:hypothetical protein
MNMSKELKKDWLPNLQARYGRRGREGKSRMLDEPSNCSGAACPLPRE